MPLQVESLSIFCSLLHRNETIKKALEWMSYRRIGYLEQTYYIISAWFRGLFRKK